MNSRLFLKLSMIIIFSLASCKKDNKEYLSDNDADFKIDNSVIKFKATAERINYSNTDGKIKLILKNDFNFERYSFTTVFTVKSKELKIGIGKGSGGLVLNNNEIKIYDNNALLIHKSSLKDGLKLSKDYSLSLKKEIDLITYSLFEGDNNLLFSKSFPINEYLDAVILRGDPYLKLYSGNFSIGSVLITTPYSTPLVSVYGDSFVEGGNLLLNRADIKSKWTYLLGKDIGFDNVLVDARGGIRVSFEFFERFKIQNEYYKSKYVILGIGTNNYSNIYEYFEYMTNIINYLKSNNQIPILVTVTPRDKYIFANSAMLINNWVKKVGVQYIDFHKAVTELNKPEVWVESYVDSDGIHPSVEGYRRMYEQLKIDLKDVLKF
ncbi:SGNH/GDSL hydrolase family protein [Sphingobacterium sp. HMA12]|uniref:SGNH/GDSL hydrolase family protein n=1 Tax=Sphingobacterium sp. HMA12 TaxID=2050894 RepID=UPI000CEA450D|nr:SGNH/GDSL hydrolase family protein [Sphingobacterium sp. HMA12]